MKTYQAQPGHVLIVISNLLAVVSVAGLVGLRWLLLNVPQGVSNPNAAAGDRRHR